MERTTQIVDSPENVSYKWRDRMSCLVCTNLFYYNFVVLPILMGAGIYQNEEPIVLGDYDMLYEPIMMGICIIFEKSLMRLLIGYFEIKERFSMHCYYYSSKQAYTLKENNYIYNTLYLVVQRKKQFCSTSEHTGRSWFTSIQKEKEIYKILQKAQLFLYKYRLKPIWNQYK